jgi:hypothetical protein
MIHLLVYIGLIGLVAWGLCQIPMPDGIKKAIVIAAIAFVILLILQAFGLLPSEIHMPSRG